MCLRFFEKGRRARDNYVTQDAELMELKLKADRLKKECDFYFSKLQDIKLVCQEHESENPGVLSKILDIVYAAEEHFERCRAGETSGRGESAVVRLLDREK